MIVLGILVSIAAIGTMCWLLFNLAVFALPFFIGLNAGALAYDTGAGWLGGIVVGLLAAGLTLAVGQGLLMLIRPMWARRKRPACPLCRECCVEGSVHYRIMDTIGVACDEASEASGLV
ncbi:hypothetical protein [Martelella sp. AD-3]|uniref:hypothetical protein n=1 Tax=Martelella sp. AD-3 TaxID=686597 RepID=UPI0004651B90|nr:hypothetical protein [Martelella sp. AD-3]